jgi:hypothetical protein
MESFHAIQASSRHAADGGAAAVAGALGGPRHPRGNSLVRLLRFERRWLVAVFETLLPSGADARLTVGAADVPMGRYVDDLLARAPLPSVLGMRAALWLVVFAPPFVLRRRCTFLGLTASDRLALLGRLQASDRYLIRETAMLFKFLACLGFCGLAMVQQRLGIHPLDPAPPSWAREDA